MTPGNVYKQLIKMKTYVITVSDNFPVSHPRAGEPTEFEKGIKTGCKIHTIRSNVPLWLHRIAQVRSGEAVLSIRKWSGKPYRSKQIELIRLGAENGVGAQIVELADDYRAKVYDFPVKKNDRFAGVSITKLADNDGLTRTDFDAWFSEWNDSSQKVIIHFSAFRYEYDFRCGHDANRCNCKSPEECGYIEMAQRGNEYYSEPAASEVAQ